MPILECYQPFDIGKLRTGYFVLYKHTGDWMGRIIEKEQLKRGIKPEDACYVHVDVLGPQEWAIRVNPPKAEIVNIKAHYFGREAAIVRYRADDYDRERHYVAWWAVSHNNLRYDWLGVLKFRLGWMFHRQELFFCSENAAWALRKRYPFAFGKVPDHVVMPGHFFNGEFEVVWRGVIQ